MRQKRLQGYQSARISILGGVERRCERPEPQVASSEEAALGIKSVLGPRFSHLAVSTVGDWLQALLTILPVMVCGQVSEPSEDKSKAQTHQRNLVSGINAAPNL